MRQYSCLLPPLGGARETASALSSLGSAWGCPLGPGAPSRLQLHGVRPRVITASKGLRPAPCISRFSVLTLVNCSHVCGIGAPRPVYSGARPSPRESGFSDRLPESQASVSLPAAVSQRCVQCAELNTESLTTAAGGRDGCLPSYILFYFVHMGAHTPWWRMEVRG